MRALRRALEIGRTEGARTLLFRALRWGHKRSRHRFHQLTVARPFDWYLRNRESRHALGVLRLSRRLARWVFSVQFVPGERLPLRHVDPADIVGYSPNDPPIYWGELKPGDWDLRATPFDECAVNRSIQLHYEAGVPWEETPLRQYFDEMMAGGGAWGYDSPDEFPQRVADIEALVESVRTHGYRTASELPEAGTTELVPPTLDEVTVDVGRDGRYHYRNLGQHRIAVAKLLDVDEIPVRVGAYHPDIVDDVVDSPAPSRERTPPESGDSA
jgi:hypothetical protein